MALLLIVAALAGLLRAGPLLTPDIDRIPEEDRVGSGCAVPRRNSVYEALDELFTCLVRTRVEASEWHKFAVARLTFGRLAGSGAAQRPLLAWPGGVSTERLISRHPGHRLFYEMAPLFPPELGFNETRGDGESARISAYLAHLEASPYVVDTYWTLKSNGALPDAAATLRDFVRVVMFDHWFKPYGRQAKQHRRGLRDSSGFGHVFVGEVSGRGVTGFHNWLAVLAAEENGTFVYKGYVKAVKEPLVMAEIQFDWLGKEKPQSTIAFGLDTEFQLALFSACYVVKPGKKTRLKIKDRPVAVQTFVVNHQQESVGSAYFVI